MERMNQINFKELVPRYGEHIGIIAAFVFYLIKMILGCFRGMIKIQIGGEV